MKLTSLNYAYDSDDRYVSTNISNAKSGKENYFNATFIVHKKIIWQKLIFKLFIPMYQNDSKCDNKLFETSIDLCQAGKIIKSNLMVRLFMQNFINCSIDSFSCPYEKQLRLRNCPISSVLGKMPSNVIPLRRARIELNTFGKVVNDKKVKQFFNITIFAGIKD